MGALANPIPAGLRIMPDLKNERLCITFVYHGAKKYGL